MKKKSFFVSAISITAVLGTLIFCMVESDTFKPINVSTIVSEDFQNLSNKKICWGIKRSDNHEQPDVGKENKRINKK